MTDWAADFSWFQVNAATLLAAGYRGAVRYINPGNGKAITATELADLTGTPGMALALVNETFAQAAGGGFARGQQEAIIAFQRAKLLGWPDSRPIYFVLEDPNWISPPWPALEDYLRGVLSVVPVERVGDYGSARQINHMLDLGLCRYGWAVETWPGEAARCHLRQMFNAVPGAPTNFPGPGGPQVDPNEILQPDWGQWTATAPTPTPIGVPDMTPDEHAALAEVRDMLRPVFQAVTATDAAKDDNSQPIPDHWAIGYTLAHARQVDAKLDVLAAKIAALPAPVGGVVDVTALAAEIVRQIAAKLS